MTECSMQYDQVHVVSPLSVWPAPSARPHRGAALGHGTAQTRNEKKKRAGQTFNQDEFRERGVGDGVGRVVGG